MAALNARIRAAISQWPMLVVSAITTRQTHWMMKLTRPEPSRRRIVTTSKINEIAKPARLITDNERVTIVPAISFAFGRPNDLNTLNAAGATTAPKNNAAPNQQASKISRVTFTVGFPQSHKEAQKHKISKGFVPLCG